MSQQADYLIIGQGLAGSVLARILLQRGRRVVVADEANPSAASRVSAGLVNPVTGMKLVKTRQAEILIPNARDFYRSWESELGCQFFHDRVIWRFFQSAREQELWEKKKDTPELAPFVEALPQIREHLLCPQRGGFALRQAGNLDTVTLLDLVRQKLKVDQVLVEGKVNPGAVEVDSNGVSWQGIRAKRVIFCEGAGARENPWFSWIPFKNAKGETLTIRGPALAHKVVYNRGKWLLPLSDGLYRAGATYEWNDLTTVPTDAGREEILSGLRSLVTWEPKVEHHQAGIRPIVADTHPALGLHPTQPRVGIFNGLGSKGVIWAPYFAEQLVRHLEDGTPIDATADVRRNL
jgi:glycine oxidase